MPTRFVDISPGAGINGIWMRWCSPSKGQHHYLWRAVDQDGYTLDILMQSRRDRNAAKRFFRNLLKGMAYVLRVIITDNTQQHPGKSFLLLAQFERCLIQERTQAGLTAARAR